MNLYSLTDLQFWFGLVSIFVSFILALYIPGRVVLGGSSITKLRVSHAIAIVLGAVLWAWQGYIFGMLQLRFLSYLYLLVFLILFIKQGYFRKKFISTLRPFIDDKVALIIIGTGVLGQIFPYLRMGLGSREGMILAAHNLEDHIWHAGLVRELVTRFPPFEPGMSGIPLKDYHFWFNLLAADLIRVFHLPPLQTQFVGLYALSSILLGIIAYSFAKYIYPSKIFTRLFMILLFFCGDVVGWFLLVKTGTFNLDASSLIINGTKFLDSPAFALSILAAFVGMYLLFYYKNDLDKKIIIVCALIFGSLLEFKVYTGITVMFGFAVYAGYNLLKKHYRIFATFVISSIVGALVFFPGTSSSGGLFFLPFEIPRSFITQSILGLTDWELRWRVYQDYGNYLRIVHYGLMMTGVYFVVQYGPLLVGVLPLKRTIRALGFERFIFLYGTIFSGIIIGTFFYQKVGGANIWEFFLPAGIFLCFISAFTITLLIEKRGRAFIVVICFVVILLILPRWINTITLYIKEEYLSGFHGVDQDTYAAYQKLWNTTRPGEIVMVVNYPKHVAYVSEMKALSGSDLYLSGEGVRQQVTPEIEERRKFVKEVNTSNMGQNLEKLRKDGIKYLYYFGSFPEGMLYDNNFEVIIKNSSATIFRLK